MSCTAQTTAEPDKPATAIDPIEFRNTCGSFATGVTIISTRDGDVDHGMTANAFMSISLDPPLIAISIGRAANILERIRNSGRFAVSILAEGTEDLAMHFAGRPNDKIDDPLTDFDGLPVARPTCAVFASDVECEVDGGDHVIFLGRVTAMSGNPAAQPLIFYKGKFGGLEPDADPNAEIPLDVLWHDAHW